MWVGKENFVVFLLIKNNIILKFVIWVIQKISDSQMMQSLKLIML